MGEETGVKVAGADENCDGDESHGARFGDVSDGNSSGPEFQQANKKDRKKV